MFRMIGLLGRALAVSPWALNYNSDGTALLTSIIVGALVVSASGYEVVVTQHSSRSAA
jgi:SPW repeat